jgi:hypothetical protein
VGGEHGTSKLLAGLRGTGDEGAKMLLLMAPVEPFLRKQSEVTLGGQAADDRRQHMARRRVALGSLSLNLVDGISLSHSTSSLDIRSPRQLVLFRGLEETLDFVRAFGPKSPVRA